jgi:hypothetical protein
MIPSYLYHYTSLETLLLILKTNKIRFNRLDRMNDPFEGHSSLFLDARQSIFATSWTAEYLDELPMWKMYTDLKGVRLRMPIDLFDHKNALKVVKMNRSNNFLIQSELNQTYTIERQPLPYTIDKNYPGELTLNRVYGPSKVEYLDSLENLEKNVIVKDAKQTFDFYEINLNLIGQKKLEFWSFEKEYRYRIFYGNSIMLAGSDRVLTELFTNSPVITKFIDIEYKTESLENVEIVLGPKTDMIAKEKVEQLLREKNISSFDIKVSRIRIN